MTRLLSILLLLCPTLAGLSQDLHLRDSARLFGRGSISNGDFVFNASFTPDGNTVYFSKATMNWNYIAIYYATKEGDGWSMPRPVPFTGIYRDTDPFVSSDGKRLYFTSDRPLEGKPFKDFDYHLFYVDLKGHSAPVQLALPIPPDMKILYPSFADNGNLYFCAPDSSGQAHIYSCALVNGAYQSPVRLSFSDPHEKDIDPVVSRDESFLLFASLTRKGSGSVDLWVSFRKGNEWGAPVNMGSQVNSPGMETTPGLSPDNKTCYFSASRETVKARPTGKITAETVDHLFHSPENGMLQIYEIDISDIK